MKMFPVGFYHHRARVFVVILIVSLVSYFLVRFILSFF